MISNVKRILVPVLLVTLSYTSFGQKQAPNGWHLADPKTSGYYGISLDKAYQFLSSKKSTPVVVAVIDSGIDTTHEDLRPVLWTNPKEIPGNGIDDDRNGYVDDVHGWNFLGGKDGRVVTVDSYEATRVYHKYKSRFENVADAASLNKDDQDLYKMWVKAAADIAGDPNAALNLMLISNAYKAALGADSTLQKELDKKVFSANEVQSFTPATEAGKAAKKKYLFLYQGLGLEPDKTNKDVLTEIGDYVSGEERKASAKETPPQAYRAEIVKDNEDDINDRSYGNNNIMTSTAMHGTHVSGIIAAARNNDKGIDGIDNNVKIMMIRAVPDGDEHDKDIALAIRYAADNGARVINMSFGKGVSPQKTWVDDAVKYAAQKGVLLIHAAGNENADIDTSWNFPNPVFKADQKRATNWVTVGASGAGKDALTAGFSNYGKAEVDLFAPGVNIYSSLPGGTTYGNLSGTSMASPVVAGVAALILEYYPSLTPEQVKMILEKSAVPFTEKVRKPGTDQQVRLSDLSRTGGLVNAFEAVKLADSITKAGKTSNKVTETKIKVKTATSSKKIKIKAA